MSRRRRHLRAALALALAVLPAAVRAEGPRSWRPGFTYTADLLANVSGGVDEGAAWLGRADLTLEMQGEAIGLPGATFFFDLIYTHGPDFSGRRVGDAQVVSNVQGDGVLRPYEAYVELPFGAGVSAKTGLIDLNTEFDVQSVGAFFTNSSHGVGIDFSQSGRNGPSIFPVTSAAVLLRWETERWSVGAGLFNAVAGHPDRPTRIRLAFPGEDGSLLIAEAGARVGPSVRIQLGGWAYTSREALIDAPARSAGGSKGGYGQVELSLTRGEGPRLDGWVRTGTASGPTNRVTGYVGGGVTYGTDAGRVGLAVAHARQSGRAASFFAVEEGPQRGAETSLELGYAAQLTPFLTVQPVVHYVIHPGWRADVPDALILGLRLAFAIEP